MLHLLHDAVPQAAFDQGQNASVADLPRHLRHQPVVRDRVEIALKVGVDHMDIAGLQQSLDFPQRAPRFREGRLLQPRPGRKP
jgi:hypothetical protein